MAKNPAAVALGKLGGSATSQRKTAANRANAKKPRQSAFAMLKLLLRVSECAGEPACSPHEPCTVCVVRAWADRPRSKRTPV